ALHTFGSEQVIEEEMIISGIVIADDESGNFYRNLVIQDETAGIEVRFGLTDLYNDYPMGRRVFVNCKGLTLSDYNGVTQIGEIQEALINDHICRGEKGQVVTPTIKKISELTVNDISTLVQLEEVQFANSSAGVTYADAINLESLNLNVEECNSEDVILLRTSGYATFAADVTPIESGTLTAVYSVYRDDQQLYIRSTADVDFTQERCGAGMVTDGISEDFQSTVQDNIDVDIDGWTNVAAKGSRLWRGDEFGGNLSVQATAYNDTNAEMETWLITPGIDLSTAKVLSFSSQVGFPISGHDGLSVWISTDYNGINFGTATWQALSGDVVNSSSPENTWIPSGVIDLSAYSGTAYIGFKYEGSGPNGQTSSYRVDDVVIEEK
ncbi:MAG: choice-of-anchor J domain-containing protein, partial [Phaeodactylibacter sp.]|nr:choice-of-anchor J domain-containing protein [Phaeodactylibacter sp.]